MASVLAHRSGGKGVDGKKRMKVAKPGLIYLGHHFSVLNRTPASLIQRSFNG